MVVLGILLSGQPLLLVLEVFVLSCFAIKLFIVLDGRCLLLAAGAGLHHLISFVNGVFGLMIYVNLTVTVPIFVVLVSLVAISEPIMEIVTELLQDIHVVPDLAGAVVAALRERAVAGQMIGAAGAILMAWRILLVRILFASGEELLSFGAAYLPTLGIAHAVALNLIG